MELFVTIINYSLIIMTGLAVIYYGIAAIAVTGALIYAGWNDLYSAAIRAAKKVKSDINNPYY